MPLPELSEVHETFLALSRLARESFAGQLGGQLLFRSGFDPQGVTVVVAASIAGAASLCVDADAELLRQGLRTGLCDFVVANLDEALRILKNEIRRQLPVSVGLPADPAACVTELLERGVQPDLLSLTSPATEDQERILVERGALLVPEAAADPDTSLLEWSVATDPARLLPQIARMAADSLDPDRADTPARRDWLERSPRYLGRSFGRRQCLRMTEAEASRFVALTRSESVTVTITRNGHPL